MQMRADMLMNALICMLISLYANYNTSDEPRGGGVKRKGPLRQDDACAAKRVKCLDL